MNEKGMSTVDLQFYEHDLGRHVGYYGKAYEPLELFDLKIKGLIPEDMPETASVTFEKADTQLDMFEDMEPSVETEYEDEDENGVYINHETVATNNKSDLYRITLSSGDLSATFYYQDCSHEDYFNSQNNRRECKVISEEEYKSRVEAMREDAGLSDRDEEEL